MSTMNVHPLDRTQANHTPALERLAKFQAELERIDNGYQRFFKKLGGKPHIKARHKFKSITLKQTGYKLTNNRIVITFRKWDKGKWRYDKVAYTFHKHRQWHGTISRITIKRDACGNYYLCIITTIRILNLCPQQVKALGRTSV